MKALNVAFAFPGGLIVLKFPIFGQIPLVDSTENFTDRIIGDTLGSNKLPRMELFRTVENWIKMVVFKYLTVVTHRKLNGYGSNLASS